MRLATVGTVCLSKLSYRSTPALVLLCEEFGAVLIVADHHLEVVDVSSVRHCGIGPYLLAALLPLPLTSISRGKM